MVIKTTFGQFRRWSLIGGTLGIETEEKNNLNFANKVFNRKDVFILGGLNSGISLYAYPSADVVQYTSHEIVWFHTEVFKLVSV